LSLRVCFDKRWPRTSGIGRVMEAMVRHAPDSVELADIAPRRRLGSSFAPLDLTLAILRHQGAAIFWNPGFVPPLTHSIPSVVTVHDLTHLYYYGRARRLYYNSVFRPLYRRCEAIICVSEFTRNEFLEWSRIEHDRVHVVRNDVDPIFTRSRDALVTGGEYILFPGNRRNYKNIGRLVQAYARSSLPKRKIDLALTGAPDDVLIERARRFDIMARLRFLGVVPDEDMPRVYRGALAVAFVSLSEGFGMPILEGFASEVPVVTSNISAMPEVAGGAAMLVEPTSVDAIAAALDAVTTDSTLRERLVTAGLSRLADFSWKRSAADFWQIVQRIGAERGCA
jgi:glycosyltransferase involved in cell wall biosynthesis